MKKTFSIVAIASLFLFPLFSSVAEARTVRVRSTIRKSGVYVPAHYRTAPNRSRLDNWSTKGNYNPYTGKKGSVNIFRLRY